jgi:cytochrome c-type biogenesis protein CcmH/NrfG
MAAKARKHVSRSAKAPPPAGTPASTVALIALALALVTIGVYAQVASHEFIDLDDTGYVVINAHVNTGLTPDNVRWAFTTGYAANWHPLTWMSHQLDVSLLGMQPGRQHLVNVAWHVLNTLLLFGLLRVMTGAVWRSAFVAGLFAVHPAHVESVAWIAERKDLLSACLWLATTWAYVKWVQRPSTPRYGAVVVLFALGLMAKPMLVTLPFALLLLDVWPLERVTVTWRRRVTEKLPLIALAVVSSGITLMVQKSGNAVSTLDLVSIADRFANAVVSYGRYLRMLAWPVDLALFYPYVTKLPGALVALTSVVLAALTVLAWRTRRSQPYLLVGWLWFLGTLVPVIGFVQIGVQALADRYTYIPYIGLFVAIVWGAEHWATRLRVTPGVLRTAGAGLVAALALVAHAQAATWTNTETVWRRALDVTTDNAHAANSLGVVYGRAGRPAEAAAEFQEALRLKPTLADGKDVYPNLGRALMAQGKAAEAIPYLERARALNPERADLCHELALAYMGVVLAASRRIDEARAAFAEAARINPARQDARDALKTLGGK